MNKILKNQVIKKFKKIANFKCSKCDEPDVAKIIIYI